MQLFWSNETILIELKYIYTYISHSQALPFLSIYPRRTLVWVHTLDIHFSTFCGSKDLGATHVAITIEEINKMVYIHQENSKQW